jgi:hypothetical protein
MVVFGKIKNFLKGTTDTELDEGGYYNKGVRLTNLGRNKEAVEALNEAKNSPLVFLVQINHLNE